MAMVTLRSLMDRWETGDQDVLELVDQTFWQQGLDVDDDAAAGRAAPVPPLRGRRQRHEALGHGAGVPGAPEGSRCQARGVGSTFVHRFF